MTIKKALKLKVKLVADANLAFTRMTAYNSVEEGSERVYDPKVMYNEWVFKTTQLVELKTKIHKANLKVYDKIFALSELKSQVQKLKVLDCTSGKVNDRYGGTSKIKTTVITILERDEIVKELEEKIEQIQEQLDIHNLKTKI